MSESFCNISPLNNNNENLSSSLENLISDLSKITVSESEENRNICVIAFESDNNMTTVPSFLKVHAETIPEFDGDVNELNFFIESIDTIVSHFYDKKNLDVYQNNVIYRTIISKLKGAAREVINISCVNTIDEIKNELIRNFSDPRNENCLAFDLNNLKQKREETPYEFHDRVRKLLNTISNYLAIHEKDANVRKFKQNLYNDQALEVFLAGLKNPYGIMVRTKEPKTMLEAINFIKKEDNIKYLQNYQSNYNFNQHNVQKQDPNFNKFKKSQQSKNLFQRTLNPNYFHQDYQSTRENSVFPYAAYANRSNTIATDARQTNQNPQENLPFPTGPVSIQQRQNLPQQKFPTHTQVFGRPKNVWKQNPSQTLHQPKPIPMSITSRQPSTSQKFQQSTPKWSQEQLHNTEHTDAIDDNQDLFMTENNTDYEYVEGDYNTACANFPLTQQYNPQL